MARRDYRSVGTTRGGASPYITSSALTQAQADRFRPSVFDAARDLSNQSSRDFLQEGLSWFGRQKFEDVTYQVSDETFINEFTPEIGNRMAERTGGRLTGVQTAESIIESTTPEERRATLLELGKIKDERVYREDAPLGYGDDFIHRINQSQIPDAYDHMTAYGRIRDRLINSDTFSFDFKRFLEDNYEPETIQTMSEERLKEIQHDFFNIYRGKDDDEEYQKYLSGELEEEFTQEEAALDILKRRDRESLEAHEKMVERALDLSTDSGSMQMLKLMGGTLLNPVDAAIIAGDILIGTHGAATVSKFSKVAKFMEWIKLHNTRMVPGTNNARRAEDINKVAWTLARREMVYLGLMEGTVGAMEYHYYRESGDSVSEAFAKASDRIILAPAAGMAIRGPGSIIFDKIKLRGGVKGIIGVDEIGVMTRQLETAFGTKGNPGARVEISRLLNEATEMKTINDVPVLMFRNTNTEIDEVIKNMAESTIAKQQDDLLRSGEKEILDFVIDKKGHVTTHLDVAYGIMGKMDINKKGDLTIKKKKLSDVEKKLLNEMGVDTTKKADDVVLGYSQFRKMDIFKKEVVGDEVVINVNQSLSKTDMLTIRKSIVEWLEDSNDLVKDEFKIKDIEGYMVKMFDDNLLDAGDFSYIKNSMPTTFLMHFVNPEMSIWRRKFKQAGMKDNLTNIAIAIGSDANDITNITARGVDDKLVNIPGGGIITKKGVGLFQEASDVSFDTITDKNKFPVEELANVLAMRSDNPYESVIDFLAKIDDGAKGIPGKTQYRVTDVNKNLLNTLKVLESEGAGLRFRGIMNKLVEADINLKDINQIYNTFRIETVEVDGVKVQKIMNTETKNMLDGDISDLDELYRNLLDEKIKIKKDLQRNAVVYEMSNKQYQEYYGDVFSQFGEQNVLAKLPYRAERKGVDPKFAVIVREVDFYHGYTRFADEEVTPVVKEVEENIPDTTEAVVTPTPEVTPEPVAKPEKVELPGILGFSTKEPTKVSKVIDAVEIEKVIPPGARDITEEEVTKVSDEMFKRNLDSLAEGITPEDERFLQFLPNEQAKNVFTANGRMSEVTNMVNVRRFDDRDTNMGFWSSIQNREDAHVLSGDISRHLWKYNVAQDKYDADIVEINRKLEAMEAKRYVFKKNESDEARNKRMDKLYIDTEKLKKEKADIEHKKKIYTKPDVDDAKMAEVAAHITKKFNERVNEYMDNPMFDKELFDFDYVDINGVRYKTDGFRYKGADEKTPLMTTADEVRGRGMYVETVTSAKLPKPEKRNKNIIYVVKRKGNTPQFEFYYKGQKMVVNTNVGFNSLGKFYEHPKMGEISDKGNIFVKFKDVEDTIFSVIHREANKTMDRNTIVAGEGGKVTNFRELPVERNVSNDAIYDYNGSTYTITKQGTNDYTLSVEGPGGDVKIIGTKMKDESTAFRIISNNTDSNKSGDDVKACMVKSLI